MIAAGMSIIVVVEGVAAVKKEDNEWMNEWMNENSQTIMNKEDYRIS